MSLKSFVKGTLVAGTITAAVGAGALYLLHENTSKQVLKRIKSSLGRDSEIVATWTEPLFQRVNVDGSEPVWAIVGGVATVKDGVQNKYNFIASALTGELLDVRKVTA